MAEKKLTALSHLFVTYFMSNFASFIVYPAITDVTMSALCPATDECSLAIYLSGFQQAIIGLGTTLMMPIIGNLSDQYGRKALLTIPMTLSIIPLAVLACNRTTSYYYVYYVLKIITSMVCDGSINCLALAYLADNISENQRASAFGILSGVSSASFVCGTLAARFLSAASIFQVGTCVSMVAVVYMRIFLKESIPDDQVESSTLTQPILKEGEDTIPKIGNAPIKKPIFKKIPSLGDIICLFKSSPSFTKTAIVAFFNYLAEGGTSASTMYYLKASFHFNKNQYADLMLITGLVGTVSQLFLMPLLVSPIGDRRLLSIGLLFGFANAFLYSIAWAAWVPYAATALTAVSVFSFPSIQSIASKQVGPSEQGKAQGCIQGISSLSNVIAPLIFSPLTAYFLSEDAPIRFPGFSMMCIAIILIIGFIQSLMIESSPSSSSDKNSSNCMEV
ncbi:Tetracycline resistance protein, TetA/multidrug resistance protein MdtG [Corchorus capsularis]|uniref:Tetracycline resistance protein, TetA/multidrug resistance protein MdtG n=1 Tax=Corchorus capsularis TaxID=210143 RepID=A0A1R3H5Z3_COCAP|nr:Tetracycline resistance protein, TetA/multidrug resistance protein MdtG [Corchorus capsularis]